MKCKDCGNTHPALSGFPSHVLCDYYHLHMSNIADASRCEHFKPKVTTNADRIRAMTDEEMAEFFQNTTFCDSCFIFKNECGTEKYSCKQRWLDWLKQEAKE